MPVVLRSATDADAKHVESLLAELGYPSKEADVRHRLRRLLDSDNSCFLVAQQASEVIGLVSAELVPYFLNGSTICRVTGLVVSTHHRGQGIGEKLVTGAADFAREHPQYCRATPTECCPFLGKLVSSMIHASIGPWRCNSGSTSSRTFARTFSSDDLPSPRKCSS